MGPDLIFWELFQAPTEVKLHEIVQNHEVLADPHNWRPYGKIESNFGVVENQQSSPIPALVEKVTNAIDAILTRRCHQEGLDPKSGDAPRSIEAATRRFFPASANWDLPRFRRGQAESIQIVADGPRFDTSLIIYDDGEGQHPQDFEDTFLSLLRGNKNQIHFVHGKYNMGGAGAIVFCGRHRYQLIGSKRWDRSGDFGFTLVRRHPLSERERKTKRATWYEYFVMHSQIPSFPIVDIELGLHNRKFTTGTVIKLYSYDLPSGSRSVISRDLNQSLNEYLFVPALPILTVDKSIRYPKDRNLQRDLYGLKRRLEEDDNRYVDHSFSEEIADGDMGSAKVTTYVFHSKIDDRSVRDTKQMIRREFFKNKMSVIFSIDGQVHGHYTSEFITRTLKFQLLKDYVLIHVDCTDLKLEFRNELFMASRDRLKDGYQSRQLRSSLGEVLRSGRLKEIYKTRKAAIAVDSRDTEDLLRSFTANLPLRDDLFRLLGHTFKLDDKRRGRRRKARTKKVAKGANSQPTFSSKRFPSFFRLKRQGGEGRVPMFQVPMGGRRTIPFSSDVEDQYFDRVAEPGELTIGLLGFDRRGSGGESRALPSRVEDVVNVVKSSPREGTIRISLSPTGKAEVGDAMRIRATLSSAGEEFEETFLVKIADRQQKVAPANDGNSQPDEIAGLPNLVRVYSTKGRGDMSWAQLEEGGIDMAHDVTVHPAVDGEVLTSVYVNMESTVFLNYRSKLSSQEQIEVAERRYLSSVYFHVLFLYTITQKRGFSLRSTVADGDEPVEIVDYLRDLFANDYANFLLNFEMEELIAALEA